MSYIVAKHFQDAIKAEQLARQRQHMNAWQAYKGELPEPLKVERDKPNDNVRVNYARLIVDKGVSFLFGKMPIVEERVRNTELEERTENEKWLDEAWIANKGIATLQKIAQNGGVCGHPYVKLVPNKDESDEDNFPRIIVLDPSTVTPHWSPDDIEDVFKYVISYNAWDEKTKKVYEYRETHERSEDGTEWTVLNEVVDITSGSVISAKTTPWPYRWCAIHDCQNLPAANEYWGTSDLEDDIIGLNKTLNFVLSNINKILRHHAHPKTWAKGITAAQIDISTDEMLLLQAPDATIQNLEMESDLASSIEFYKRIKEVLHQLARIPEFTVGKAENVGQLSGLALVVMYQPLVEKTETKRALYGEMLTRLCEHMLELANKGERIKLKISWPELLPRDPLQERQMYQIEALLGTSGWTLLQLMGRDPALEQKRKQQEQEMALEFQVRQATEMAKANPQPATGGTSSPTKGSGKPLTRDKGRSPSDKQNSDNYNEPRK